MVEFPLEALGDRLGSQSGVWTVMESVGDLQSLGAVGPRLISSICFQAGDVGTHTAMDPANQPAEWPILDLNLPDNEPK